MKIHLNAPQDAAVFSATYGIWQAAKTAIVTGTAISIFAEFTISYSLIQQHLTQFITIPAAVAAVMAGVFVTVLAVERVRYGRQAAKLYTDKDARSLGADANAVVLLVCLAVYGISGLLSYVGSISAATAIPPAAVQDNTKADNTAAQAIQAIQTQYSADSAATAKQWTARINAERSQHTAKINGIQAQIKSGKHWLRPQLKAAQNERQASINELQAAQAAALLRATEQRRADIAQARQAAATTGELITRQNTTAADRHNYLTGKLEAILPAVGCGALVVLLLGLFIDERFKYKAGIKEVVLISDHDNLPSIFSEFKEAFAALFSGWLRSLALSVKRQARPAAQVVDDTAAELISINLERYKEKVLTFGGNAATGANKPLQTAQIGFKPNVPPDDKNGNNGVNAVITELFNTYRIERQRLQAYQNKQANGNGRPDTIQAGIDRHGAAMESAEAELQKLGFSVYCDRFKIQLIKTNELL